MSSPDLPDAPNQPLPLARPADPVDRELEPLLAEPFASAWAAGPADARAATSVRGRLMERLAASQAAARGMVTHRPARLAAEVLAPGVTARTLYAAPDDRPLRPGEPLRARLVDLAPGAAWAGPTHALHREWLVLSGSVELGGRWLRLRDYHAAPAGSPGAGLRTGEHEGARLFLRESALPSATGDQPLTVLDAEAGWPDFAPGLQRRVLWQRDGQAALMYCAQPGAAVPRHAHGHDEECLMVQGELFLDDVLLQPGDYQLAPAGSGHTLTQTDTGVVIYAHGDLDLRFEA